MAKVTVKFNQQAAVERVEKVFKNVKLNKKMNEEIGEFLSERIRFEARRGKPLNDSRSYPSLKPSTVDQRRRLGKFNKTHPSFSPPKSNTTFTGQLLDAVTFSFKRNKLEIFVDDSKRKPYQTGPNSRQKRPPNNAELDKFLRIIGFEIFTGKGIDSEPKITKRINSIVKRTLRRALAVANKIQGG